METVQANSANGESSDLEIYIVLCAECESIAVQIHPSYKEQHVDSSPMSMRKKKEIIKAMQARLEGQSTKDGSASASKPSCDDPPFQAQQRKQCRKGASPAEAESTQQGASHHESHGATLHESQPAETRPKKRKKEGATEHSWADNERILTNALQELGFEQLKQAISDTMPDVVTLPVTRPGPDCWAGRACWEADPDCAGNRSSQVFRFPCFKARDPCLAESSSPDDRAKTLSSILSLISSH